MSPDLKKKFAQTAEKIMSDGAAGFGEMSIEHFSILFMNIKIRKNRRDRLNHPLNRGGIDSAWISMLKEFPDRFILGTDQFFQPMQAKNKRRLELEGTKRFITSLPLELAQKIGYENVTRLFKIR